MSNQLNLAFYESLIDSMLRSIDTYKGLIDRAQADRDEAISLALEHEETIALKDVEIAKLQGEIEQLRTGFESAELERLKAIGEKIEALHNAVSNLNNPPEDAEESPEETEEIEEAEAVDELAP